MSFSGGDCILFNFRVCFLIDDGRWINICYTQIRGKCFFFLGFIIVSLIVALIKYL